MGGDDLFWEGPPRWNLETYIHEGGKGSHWEGGPGSRVNGTASGTPGRLDGERLKGNERSPGL